MSRIEIKHARKLYGDTVVIPDLTLSINEGELFTLLGPSGCGKTTLLRMIAGFNSIEGGDFYFNKDRINDIDPSKRNIGMVFQDYAIFPHLTVSGNVEFGLKQRKLAKSEIKERANKYLSLVKMEEYSDRKPKNLSGGQQQRIALARALAINPDVLLMDEPLSNLDAKLRLEMRQIIRDIQKEVGITTVYVTHDQEEAMAISDHIAVMKSGVIQQVGRPKELYHKPINEFVASFIGKTNILDASLAHKNGIAELVFLNGHIISIPEYSEENDQKVRVSIRPEDFHLVKKEDKDTFKAKIVQSTYLGLNTEYIVDIGNGQNILIAEESSFEKDLEGGDEILLKIAQDRINIYNSDGSRNLGEVLA